MKKLLMGIALSFAFFSCTEIEDSPAIDITACYLNDNSEQNYSSDFSNLPTLKEGDELSFSINLNGNGEDLYKFISQTHSKDVAISYLELPTHLIATDKNFTDKNKGIIGFKDGVQEINLKLKVKLLEKVRSRQKASLVFYLFSKSECGGAQEEVELKTDSAPTQAAD